MANIPPIHIGYVDPLKYPDDPNPALVPVEHQGLPVAGYQPQSDDKVRLVNDFKEIEERILRITDMMKTNQDIDQRLLAIGVTQLQGAFMFINRSVFKPGRVKLPGDSPETPAS